MAGGGPKSEAYRAWLKTPAGRRATKARDVDRARGIKRLIDATETQEIIRELSDVKGVPRRIMAEKMGVSPASLTFHYRGYAQRGPNFPLTVCQRSYAENVKRGAALITPDDWLYPAALGVRRRIQALVAMGYTFKWQAGQYGKDHAHAHRFAHADSKRCDGEFAKAVWSVYEKYAYRDPAEMGLPGPGIAYAKSVARKHRWGGPDAWDSDTIDDPYSYPEFTGQCGSANGYRIHLRERIPVCDQCQTAYTVYRKFPELALLMGVVGTKGGNDVTIYHSTYKD